eukprot:m.74984 g.74984  ORF g.74984 m.74984 type:complete len:357 (-) comp14390_c0_seq1:86-1156(-)
MASKAAKRSEGTASQAVQTMIGNVCRLVSLPAPEQREFNSIAVPVVCQCTELGITVEQTCAWLAGHQEDIEQLLRQHGAVLFRGFPLETAEHFDAFIKTFKGYEDLPYEESLSFAVRVDVTGRVCTTNEGKKGGQVFHHEQAQTPHWPSKLFFYCERPATRGGGTAVCPSDQVLIKLRQAHPDFVQQLEDKGVKYTAYMASVQDASKGAGRSWKSFFGRDTREEVEKRMTELGYTWEWLENDALKATSPVLKAVRQAPGTDKQVFFNQLVAQIANAKEFGASDDGEAEANLSKYMTFGDGSPLDLKALKYAQQACDECAVELLWQAKDVALLDNYLVMHARRDFDGPRRVLASLVR